ncbi:EAL domain, c-di-GMP-specific phosphodiesterase class I (or its enzymatically inactive variant) [Pseudoduganella namucuonensis]|uniref:EAL domain, c-di-GMP-specific phosphodiesterase class I (Or its enzymatically inactive variant) n=2 Tax=Pseudoduganella namucuonensis TaxID=1035707 RepID=A0A1I7JPT9_9BURK|nr:EAL domain, c-di-GMP-specific phosphodiesterase class I (or its enzymatically inactive variant) [Pseudoduganella namucuonensis]
MTHFDHSFEAKRLAALHRLNLLDTPPSESFDRITRMAARVFNLPIAAVSLTDSDRQWFKSRVGVEHSSIPRSLAPCAGVAESSAALVIADMLADPLYRDSHLARGGVRFYAGAPLVTLDGHCLGAMCVLGMEPRQATPEELAHLADLAAMVMAQIELQHALGRIDPISGLPNRNQFIEDFQDLQRVLPAGSAGMVVLINLATPEQISNAARVMNSSYLDDLVSDGARKVGVHLRPGRKLYHVAATQFALIAPAPASLDGYAAVLAERLSAGAAESSARFVATPTVGVAPFVVGESDCLDVLRTAHSAALDACDCPSRVAVYSRDGDAAYQRRFALLNEFGAALERDSGQLRLVYQPRVDLKSGACVGVEALLRWTHPTLGVVSPGEFMPVVEQSSMARAATFWVLSQAIAQQGVWRRAGLGLKMSVNVSATNLLEPDFVPVIEAILARHRLPAACLELEITESAIMAQPRKANATLEAIAAAGIGLAIDDFGTGYSSLAYLQSMPADVVKIDQSFIRELDGDERRQALVSTMVKLSHDLGLRVVAEGVESASVLTLLERFGCDEAQGYLFARPLEADSLPAWRGAARQGAAPGTPARRGWLAMLS